MERKSTKNLNDPDRDHSSDLKNSVEKKSLDGVASEHRVHLEGLRLHDQTHRKLKVRTRAIFFDKASA
jgi:hypothetical protein